MDILPAVRSTVDAEDKIVVTINCVSEASPKVVVSWTKGRETLTTGTVYQISNDTTQLQIRDYNVSNFLLHNYTCTCYNPLGSQRREIQLQGRVLLGTCASIHISCNLYNICKGNTVHLNTFRSKIKLFDAYYDTVIIYPISLKIRKRHNEPSDRELSNA